MNPRSENRYEVRFKCGTVSQVVAKTPADAAAVARVWIAAFPNGEGGSAEVGDVESVKRLD